MLGSLWYIGPMKAILHLKPLTRILSWVFDNDMLILYVHELTTEHY